MTETLVAVAVFLAGQLLTAVWIASKVNTKVDMLVEALANLRAEVEKLVDLKYVVASLTARFEDLIRRVLHLESK